MSESSLEAAKEADRGNTPRSASGSSEALLDVFSLCRIVPFLLLGAAHLAGQLHGCRQDGLAPAEGLLEFLLWCGRGELLLRLLALPESSCRISLVVGFKGGC